MAGWNRVASFHRGKIQGVKLLLSRQVLSAHLQPGKDPAIVIGEIVELLAALDEVGVTVHEEFIWLHFVDNLPPGYEFIKNNLQDLKEPLPPRIVLLEDALRSRYNVQSDGKKGRTIPDSALFVSGSKARRGVGRGGGRGGTNKGKLDRRSRSEGLSSQEKISCNHCQNSSTFDLTVPSANTLSVGGGVTRLFRAHLRFRLRRKRMETKRRDESTVMAVNQEPDSEVTADSKIDENDGGARPVSLSLRLKRMFPRLGNCRQKLQWRDELQTVDAHNL